MGFWSTNRVWPDMVATDEEPEGSVRGSSELLPNPVIYEHGSSCNEPLWVELDAPVDNEPSRRRRIWVRQGYCDVLVPHRRGRKGLGHKGPHRMEWK